MRKLDRLVESRMAQAAEYDRLLADSPLTPPGALPGSRHVYQSYAALLPAEAAPRRAQIIAALRERGIETTIGTYHMPMTTYFRTRGGHGPGDFPATDDVAARAISLPLYEGLTAAQQAQVVDALAAAVGVAGAGVS
jgi:dTDP-4-amino-4,6-dideoxygalactose transaminase